LVGVAVGTAVALELGDWLNVGLGVVEAVDVAGEVLVVFVVFPVHPATKTVASKIETINKINNCFFIVIPSLRRKFSCN
jgi:hypothetical protein